jgi:hypothetical protein
MTKCCVSQTLDLAVSEDLIVKVVDVGLLNFLIHCDLISDCAVNSVFSE